MKIRDCEYAEMVEYYKLENILRNKVKGLLFYSLLLDDLI